MVQSSPALYLVIMLHHPPPSTLQDELDRVVDTRMYNIDLNSGGGLAGQGTMQASIFCLAASGRVCLKCSASQCLIQKYSTFSTEMNIFAYHYLFSWGL